MRKEDKKCILCGEFAAAVLDRNSPGRKIKEICRPCHAKRLLDDINIIEANYQVLRKKWEKKEEEK